MVVAYLRGVLRPNHPFGSRSFTTEQIVLESLSAERLSDNMQAEVMADLSLIPAMNQKGVISTAERANSRLGRACELRLFDIYKVADQIAGRMKRDTKNELSLYQVYQIAEKSGIFEAFDAHYREEDSKPLL
jgi:hypothetical protein